MPVKPLGLRVEVGEGANLAQITLARITSAPSALASSSAWACTAGPRLEHQGLVLDQRQLVGGGEGGSGGQRGTGRGHGEDPPGAASGRLSHQGHSNATTGQEFRCVNYLAAE